MKILNILEKMAIWFLQFIFEQLQYDLEVITQQVWMRWLFPVMILYCIYVAFKYTFFFGIILIPFNMVFTAPLKWITNIYTVIIDNINKKK